VFGRHEPILGSSPRAHFPEDAKRAWQKSSWVSGQGALSCYRLPEHRSCSPWGMQAAQASNPQSNRAPACPLLALQKSVQIALPEDMKTFPDTLKKLRSFRRI